MSRVAAFRRTLLALVVLLALAGWMRTVAAAPLWVAGGALAALALESRHRVRRRLSPWLVLAALAVALGLAVATTRAISAIDRAGEAWAIGARAADVQRVVDELADDVRLVSALAEGAASGTPLPTALDEATGIVVFEEGRPAQRRGRAWTALADSGAAGVQWVRTGFHASLVARVRDTVNGAERTAIAARLVLAEPPADRFTASPLAERLGADAVRALRLDAVPLAAAAEATAGDPTAAVVPLGGSAELGVLVRAVPRSLDESRLELLERARTRLGLPLVIAAVAVLVSGWRRPARLPERIGTVAGLLTVVAVTPSGALSNVSPLFDPAAYFSRAGGPFTATVAALLVSSFLALLALFRVRRSHRVPRRRPVAALLVLAIAGAGPYLLRDLARGIAIPVGGATTTLWIAWQLAIALAAAGVLVAGAGLGRVALGTQRGLAWWPAPVVAAIAALLAPVLWDAPGAWPAWYPALWIAAIALVAAVRDGRVLVPAAALVAGCGAVTLTWGEVTRARMALAERDVPRLGAVDEDAYRLLGRWAETLERERRAPGREELLRRYATSDLAQAGYAARLATWTAPGLRTPSRSVDLVAIVDVQEAQASIAADARADGASRVLAAGDGPFTMVVAAVPHADRAVTTVAVPPRTRLLPTDPFATFTGVTTSPTRGPPYRLALRARAADGAAPVESPFTWERRGSAMIGTGVAGAPGDRRLAEVSVELRSLDALVSRGALLVLLDVGLVLVAWWGSALAGGAWRRWLRWRRRTWRRSYRSRLTFTLFAFFVLPAAAFAAWEAYRVRDDDAAARALVVREALRGLPPLADAPSLAVLAARVGQPLYAYRDGQLVAASDPLLVTLAPFGTLLPADVPAALDQADVGGVADEAVVTRPLVVGGRTRLVGFRPFAAADDALVLATPARGDDFALDLRRADLGVLVLLVAVLGGLAAWWLSGVAARALAQPIGQLRGAAAAIAAGDALPPLDDAPPAEFAPVFEAVTRMADDLDASRRALEAARQRTAAALHEVASGVVAIRPDGTVLLANPRAEVLLGRPLPADTALLPGDPPLPAAIGRPVRLVLEDPTIAPALSDAVVGARSLRVAASPMPGGVVLTLDDVGELARAQRVLAWGEMARQVAHEIKNPLTPIRLGVQHLRRAWRDGRADYADILDTNVARILAEIDHLDEIARAFSRYGTLPEEQPPAEPTDLAQVARDVVALEQLGEGEVTWRLDAPSDASATAMARADTWRDVLLNLLENARLAQARTVDVRVEPTAAHVVVTVTDDGTGIDPAVRSRVFEPHFSTRTSGSGLGLALSRRLVDGWGGRIELEPAAPRGTVARVTLRRVVGDQSSG